MNSPSRRRWLRRCEAKRPRDQAVARARLSLALAAADTGAALRVLRSLSSVTLDPNEVLRLRAWFAEQIGRSGGRATGSVGSSGART